MIYLYKRTGQTPYTRSKSWAIKLHQPPEGMNHWKLKQQDPVQPMLVLNLPWHFSATGNSVQTYDHLSLAILTDEKIEFW